MKRFFPFIFFIFTVFIFFYKTFLFGAIPFPGDLLVSEYQPWKSYSHNGIAPGGVPNKAQYFDAIRQMYPWQSLTTSIIQKKQFPLWNPYNFSGTPLFANIQSSVLYPLKLFYLIFPGCIAWTILVIVQPLLSLFFMFWYMRTIKSSVIGAVISAVSYAFCLFASTFLEYNTMNHILYLLPLSLVCVEQLKIGFKTPYALLLVTSVVMAFFAGHIQLWSGFAAFLLLYSAMRIFSDRQNPKSLHIFSGIVFLVVLGIGISAIQLLPTIELILQSARTSQPYNFLMEHLLIQPYQLVLYLIPDVFGNPANRNYLLSDSYATKSLYIGILPFILALCTMPLVKKNGIIRIFWLLFACIALFVIRSPISGVLYKIPIPFLTSSSPSNFIFLLSLSLSVLAGFGIDSVTKKDGTTVKRVLLALFGIIIVTFLIGRQQSFLSIKNYVFSLGLFGITAFLLSIQLRIPKARVVCSTALLFLLCIDLFYFFQKFNPFVPASYLYPDNSLIAWLKQKPGIDRIWGYGSAGLEENIASQLGYYSSEGYDPLYPKQYGRLIQSSENGSIGTQFTNQTRSDAVIHPGWGQTDMATNAYRLKLLALTSTKYILTRIEDPISEQTFPPSSFDLSGEFDGWRIFRYLQVLPRVFIAKTYRVCTSDQDFQRIFFDSSFDPKTTILLEKTPDISMPSDTPLMATAVITSSETNTVSITADSNQSALLFLSDTYYPGWNAYVDGVKTPVYRADYAFRAITLPKGEHQIDFRYEPESFSLGLKISIACTMLALVYIFLRKSHAE